MLQVQRITLYTLRLQATAVVRPVPTDYDAIIIQTRFQITPFRLTALTCYHRAIRYTFFFSSFLFVCCFASLQASIEFNSPYKSCHGRKCEIIRLVHNGSIIAAAGTCLPIPPNWSMEISGGFRVGGIRFYRFFIFRAPDIVRDASSDIVFYRIAGG